MRSRCTFSHSNHSHTECTEVLTIFHQQHDPVCSALSATPSQNKPGRLQLLTEPKQCYLVLLTATAGMTFRGKQSSPHAAASEEGTHQASALATDEQTLVSSVHAHDCGHTATCAVQ